MVRKAAANSTPKVMPLRLVFIQLSVVIAMRSAADWSGRSGSIASKLSGSSSWIAPLIIAFSSREG